MLVASPGARRPTALVAADEPRLRATLRASGAADAEAPLERLLTMEAAQAAVLQDIRASGASSLHGWELPAAVRLVEGPWTAEGGLVTPALKTRRAEVARRFAADIEALNAAAAK